MMPAGRGLRYGRRPPAGRHQTGCGRNPSVAHSSAAVAEASGSGRDAGDRQSSIGAAEGSVGGEDRTHPVFHPSNGEVQGNSPPVNSDRFTRDMAPQMARKHPTTETLRALFAHSGNTCAFPSCRHPLVNEKYQFVAEVCHIQAANPGGERYNAHQTDDERRAYDNLILLCHRHHVETNDVDLYPVEKFIEMKRTHEAMYREETYVVHETIVDDLTVRMEEYWSNIEWLNTIKHPVPDLAVPIDTKGSFFHTMREASETLARLESLSEAIRSSDESLNDDLLEFIEKYGCDSSEVREVPYYSNPFINRNWEVLNLGFPNCIIRVRVYLVQLEIQYLQEYLKMNPGDNEANLRFERLKHEFQDMAQSWGLVD